jgi:hypothetical protein
MMLIPVTIPISAMHSSNYAEWLDTHTPLNDAELELVNNESDLVYEAVLSYVF